MNIYKKHCGEGFDNHGRELEDDLGKLEWTHFCIQLS